MLAIFTLRSISPQLVGTLHWVVFPIIALALCGCAVKILLFRKASGKNFAAWFFCTILAIHFSIFIAGFGINLLLFPAFALALCVYYGFAWLKPVNKPSDETTTPSQQNAEDSCLNQQMQNRPTKRKIGETELRIFLAILRIPLMIIIAIFIISFSLMLAQCLLPQRLFRM